MSELVNAALEEPVIPGALTLNHAVKIAMKEDKPIMLDYWEDSVNKKVCFGIRSTEEKLLVKSSEEYTSPISKIYKVDKDYLVITENSIYVVSCNCETKKIS